MEHEHTTTLEIVDDTSAASASQESAAVTDELLVEEISIDGMCGVY